MKKLLTLSCALLAIAGCASVERSEVTVNRTRNESRETGAVVFPPVPVEDRVAGRNNNAYLAYKSATVAERAAFFTRFGTLAQRLQRETGVPASVLLAMCSVESGFGKTRTAVYANNYFGIKRQSASLNDVYQLVGQPNEDRPVTEFALEILSGDTNRIIFDEAKRRVNRYRKFASPEAGLEYVARTLLQGDNYRFAIPRYKANREAGMAKEDAAATYALEIGQKYHHLKGEFYRDRVVLPAIRRYDLTRFDL